MKVNMRSAVRRAALLGLLFMSACAQDCSCEGFESQPFPESKVDKTIMRSGELRLTSSGMSFLSNNLPAIVDAFVPGGLSFCVPPTSMTGVNICSNGSTCSSGEPGCDITLTIDNAALTPQPPSTINVKVTIGDLNEELPFTVVGGNCLLKLHKPGNENLPATIGGEIPITFRIDQSSTFKDLQIEVGDPVVDLTDIDFDIDGVGIFDLLQCEGADLLLEGSWIRNLAFGILEDQLVPLVQEQVDAQLCVPCDEGCGSGASCEDDVCRYNDGSCQQAPLGMDGQLLIGSVVEDYTQRPDAAVDMTIRAADTAIVDTGLTLGIRAGFDPVANALCAPADPIARNFTPTGLSTTVTGNATPFGQPFHFGVGLRKNAIEHMLWSVWGSGALCLDINTDKMPLLSTATLGTLLPSIRNLAYGRTSKAYIRIVPQTEPKVTLGMNTVTPSGSSYTVVDPLITIDWKDFDVHIFGFVQDRVTRIVTIRMDLLLPVAVLSDGAGSITPILGDLAAAFTNPRIIAGELVEEDPQRVLDLLPTLIGIALPSIAGSVSQPIDIPEFYGFTIDIPDENITSVDNNTTVAIFANLRIAPQPFTAAAETMILAQRVDLSETLPSGLIKPRVELDVVPGLMSLADARPVEYSYRLNNGLWSMFERTSTLRIDDPVLVVPGVHTVEVRARYVGERTTVDATPAFTTVLIDHEAPLVDIERADHIVTVDASDLVDPDHLTMRYKIITGAGTAQWSPWQPLQPLDLQELAAPDRFRLDVEVQDRAGNVGADTQTVTWQMPLEPTRDEATTSSTVRPTAGCNAAGGANPSGLALLLLVGAGAFGARRRRRNNSRRNGGNNTLRWRSIGVAAVVCLSACNCNKDTAATCDPECAVGSMCVEGQCQAIPQCTVDDDCAGAQTCEAGVCVDTSCEAQCSCAADEYAQCDGNGDCTCVPYCGKACGEGTFCCHDTDSCQSLPDPCADQVCDVGFGPVVTSDATGDSATCVASGGTCECQELPPLPVGWHGHYASIDRNAGVTAVAAFNWTYRDLMVGTIGANNDIDWVIVDGVPANGDVEGSLNGPRGGIADRGVDVGRFTAIAIDDDAVMHVFYRDEDQKSLKYARGSGTSWAIEVIDDVGDVGFWSSAVFRDGRVHVVYTARSTPAAGGGFETELRHIAFDASGSLADPTATRVVVASGPSEHPCGGDCPVRGEECFVAESACIETTNDCGTCGDGLDCLNGTCRPVFSAPPAGTLQAIGTHAKLTATATGLFVTYYDYIEDSIAFSAFDGSGWAAPQFVGGGTGPWGSGMIDADGDVHIAYMESNLDVPQLTYRNMSQTQTETIIDGIRDSTNGWLISSIGEGVDLRLDASGAPTVLFQDAYAHVLKYAVRGTSGAWSVSDVATPGTPYSGARGFYSPMLRSPDVFFTVDLSINNQASPTEAHLNVHD